MEIFTTPAGPTERILWIVLIMLVAAFLGGTWLNRQRSKAIGKWLQAGIGLLGERIAWRWIRSMNSGAEATVAETRPPFRQVQLAYFLLTREFAPLWITELLRGKRDLLSIKGHLRSDPAREYEVVPLHGKLRAALDASVEERSWQWHELSDGLGLYTQTPVDGKIIGPVSTFLKTYGPYIERLSVRKRQPHVILFLRLTGAENRPVDELIRALQKLLRQESTR